MCPVSTTVIRVLGRELSGGVVLQVCMFPVWTTATRALAKKLAGGAPNFGECTCQVWTTVIRLLAEQRVGGGVGEVSAVTVKDHHI